LMCWCCDNHWHHHHCHTSKTHDVLTAQNVFPTDLRLLKACSSFRIDAFWIPSESFQILSYNPDMFFSTKLLSLWCYYIIPLNLLFIGFTCLFAFSPL
jgi:hypothetical protein